MTTAAARSDVELRQASRHLLYEVCMLEQTGGRLQLGQDDPVRSALLESFLVHARLLAQFLGWNRRGQRTKERPEPHGPGKPDPEDVLAEDFVPGWTPGPPDKAWTPPPVISEMRAPINGRVAHLSYQRDARGIGDHRWDREGIARALLERVTALIDAVPEGRLARPAWTEWRGERSYRESKGEVFVTQGRSIGTFIPPELWDL